MRARCQLAKVSGIVARVTLTHTPVPQLTAFPLSPSLSLFLSLSLSCRPPLLLAGCKSHAIPMEVYMIRKAFFGVCVSIVVQDDGDAANHRHHRLGGGVVVVGIIARRSPLFRRRWRHCGTLSHDWPAATGHHHQFEQRRHCSLRRRGGRRSCPAAATTTAASAAATVHNVSMQLMRVAGISRRLPLRAWTAALSRACIIVVVIIIIIIIIHKCVCTMTTTTAAKRA